MITAMLDTNVLASGLLRSRRNAPPVQVLDAWRARRFALVLSAPIISELARVLSSPYFRQRLTPEQVAADLRLLQTDALITPIVVAVHGIATHPEDDLVLATAISADADYLVTGDLKLQKFGGLRGGGHREPSRVPGCPWRQLRERDYRPAKR